jgi:hypothetical protein
MKSIGFLTGEPHARHEKIITSHRIQERPGIRIIGGAMVSKKIYFSLLGLFLAVSCAQAKPERHDTLSLNPQVTKQKKQEFQEVRILNDASGLRTRIYLLESAQEPIDPPVPIKQTVEEDLQRFLNSRVAVSPTASGRLQVTIEKADVYWILPLDEKVVIDEFQLENLESPDKEFVLELKVLFETRETGKAPVIYRFDQKITLPDGRVKFPGEIRKSYERLLERYRRIFFGTVEQQFFGGSS